MFIEACVQLSLITTSASVNGMNGEWRKGDRANDNRLEEQKNNEKSTKRFAKDEQRKMNDEKYQPNRRIKNKTRTGNFSKLLTEINCEKFISYIFVATKSFIMISIDRSNDYQRRNYLQILDMVGSEFHGDKSP